MTRADAAFRRDAGDRRAPVPQFDRVHRLETTGSRSHSPGDRSGTARAPRCSRSGCGQEVPPVKRAKAGPLDLDRRPSMASPAMRLRGTPRLARRVPISVAAGGRQLLRLVTDRAPTFRRLSSLALDGDRRPGVRHDTVVASFAAITQKHPTYSHDTSATSMIPVGAVDNSAGALMRATTVVESDRHHAPPSRPDPARPRHRLPLAAAAQRRGFFGSDGARVTWC